MQMLLHPVKGYLDFARELEQLRFFVFDHQIIVLHALQQECQISTEENLNVLLALNMESKFLKFLA